MNRVHCIKVNGLNKCWAYSRSNGAGIGDKIIVVFDDDVSECVSGDDLQPVGKGIWIANMAPLCLAERSIKEVWFSDFPSDENELDVLWNKLTELHKEREVYALVDWYLNNNIDYAPKVMTWLGNRPKKKAVLSTMGRGAIPGMKDVRYDEWSLFSKHDFLRPTLSVELSEWLGLHPRDYLGSLNVRSWRDFIHKTNRRLGSVGHHIETKPSSSGLMRVFISNQVERASDNWKAWLEQPILGSSTVQEIFSNTSGPLSCLSEVVPDYAQFGQFRDECLAPRLRDLLVGDMRGSDLPIERPLVRYPKHVADILGKSGLEVAINVEIIERPHDSKWYMPFNMYMLAEEILSVMCESQEGRAFRLECQLTIRKNKAHIQIVERGLTLSHDVFRRWPDSSLGQKHGNHMKGVLKAIRLLGAERVSVTNGGSAKTGTWAGDQWSWDAGSESDAVGPFCLGFDIPCVVLNGGQEVDGPNRDG